MAEFYRQTMQALDELGFPTHIQSHPNEVDPAPRFSEDVTHASYDPDAAHLFWRQLLQASRVLDQFRSRFMGKVFPGGGDEGAFYAYAYPEPDGFADHPVSPTEAYYSKDLGEYLLPYEVVRRAADPDQVLLGFLQDTYEAAAIHADWDRAALEDDPDRWRAYQRRA